MATYNFLDKTGLGLVWAKIKALIPTKTSQLTNDSDYTTSSAVTSTLSGYSLTSHVHGNITSGGDITATATIANGDRIVINDESASKVTNSSITFGTSTGQYLANNGTWQSVPVTSVNSKTGAVSLTASDVGAITSSDLNTKLKNYASLVAATNIPANSDLNDTDFLKVGSYAQTLTANTSTIINKPSNLTVAFMMNVYSPLAGEGNSQVVEGSWLYRVQEIMAYNGYQKWARLCSTDGNGNWICPAWTQLYPMTDTNTTYTLSLSGNVITLTGSDGSTSSVTLPVYNGGVS